MKDPKEDEALTEILREMLNGPFVGHEGIEAFVENEYGFLSHIFQKGIEFSRLQSTIHGLPGESEFNAEIAMECIGLYSKQYDDEETGIHFKQRMDFLLTAERLRSKALAVKPENNGLASVEQLVHFLDWMNKTAAQNPMQFETDHDDIAMMYLADNPLPPPPVEKGGV